MAGDAAQRLWTVAEFLEWDGGDPDVHFELVNGRIVAMAPPSVAHGIIAINLSVVLRTKLSLPCLPISQAGIRLPNRNDSFYEVDIAVSCAAHGRGDRWVKDPVLLVEILSPSTRSHDRGQKLPDYAEIPSVQEILLVDSTRRRVTLWSRRDEGWLVRDFIGDSAVPLACLDAAVPLDAIYAGAE